MAQGYRPRRRALRRAAKRILNDYDTWRAEHQAEIAEIVAWAETQDEKAGVK